MTKNKPSTTPPILFLIFNRPEKTQLVFEKICAAKPSQLFIAADGPRKERPGEITLCETTRRQLLERIDWPCQIETLFRKKNLGCKRAVSSAIDWFFEQVEEGIILEDDCLPDLSFFRFCSGLLERYRVDEQVMMISGSNVHPTPQTEESYGFSKYTPIWGWATWRRAWKHYDLEMKSWPAFYSSHYLHQFLSQSMARRREQQFEKAFQGQTSTWDTQWLFTCLNTRGLSVIPRVNLVTNIDSGGTHMKLYDPCIHQPSTPMVFPLDHPTHMTPNPNDDRNAQRYGAVRSWHRNLFLIATYLWTTLKTRPKHLPADIRTISKSIFLEISTRLKRQAS